MRWLLTVFFALAVLTLLQPWLQRLGVGRLPGDLRFRVRGREVSLPFASTVLLSALMYAIGKLI